MQYESNYKNALNALKLAIGMDIKDSLDIVGDLTIDENEAMPSSNETIGKALSENFNLKALKRQIDVADKIIDIRKSDYYPTAAAFANYTYQGQSNTFNFSGQTAKSASAGLSVSLSLFNGFQTDAKTNRLSLTNYRFKKAKRK